MRFGVHLNFVANLFKVLERKRLCVIYWCIIMTMNFNYPTQNRSYDHVRSRIRLGVVTVPFRNGVDAGSD